MHRIEAQIAQVAQPVRHAMKARVVRTARTARAGLVGTALLTALALSVSGCSGSSAPPKDLAGSVNVPAASAGTQSVNPSATTAPSGTTSSGVPTPASSAAGEASAPVLGQAAGLCEAAERFNDFSDEQTTDAQRKQALKAIDEMIKVWPSDTKDAAKRYFGELRKYVVAGQAPDLETLSPEFQSAFGVLIGVLAKECPASFE